MKMNGDKFHFLIAGNKYEHLWTIRENIGVTINRNLKFKEHVKHILASAGKRLSALARISHILTFSKMRVLIKSFFWLPIFLLSFDLDVL